MGKQKNRRIISKPNKMSRAKYNERLKNISKELIFYKKTTTVILGQPLLEATEIKRKIHHEKIFFEQKMEEFLKAIDPVSNTNLQILNEMCLHASMSKRALNHTGFNFFALFQRHNRAVAYKYPDEFERQVRSVCSELDDELSMSSQSNITFVCIERPWIIGSADVIVGCRGSKMLLELKNISLKTLTKEFLEHEGTHKVRKSSDYYWQVQIYFRIFKPDFIYFVLLVDEHGLVVVKVDEEVIEPISWTHMFKAWLMGIVTSSIVSRKKPIDEFVQKFIWNKWKSAERKLFFEEAPQIANERDHAADAQFALYLKGLVSRLETTLHYQRRMKSPSSLLFQEFAKPGIAPSLNGRDLEPLFTPLALISASNQNSVINAVYQRPFANLENDEHNYRLSADLESNQQSKTKAADSWNDQELDAAMEETESFRSFFRARHK